ncbi:S1 family peptidase [Timonella senegalensis]|uniref:S1 family peptidase n=1 Tax=Timonella senegalensis TaxID=1465825 RepID=UPI0028AF9D77|nr:S1 family peptidase [Timonella senegalensis]
MARSIHVLRSGALGTALTALLLSITLPSSAQELADTTDTTPVMSHQEALSLDAEEFTKTSSLSEEDMESRLELENEIAGSIEEIRTISGSRLSAVYVLPEEALAIHVRLTGDNEIERLSELSSSLPVPLHVEYGATYSQEELVEATNEISERIVLENIKGVDGVEVSGTTESLVFVTNSEADNSTRSSLVGIASEVLGPKPDVASRGVIHSPIGVVFEEHEGSAENTSRGGVALSSCTSGFTVVSGSVRGFLTAGHCGNTQKFSTTPTGSLTQSSTFKSQNYGKAADIQWHTPTVAASFKQFFGSSATSATTQLGTQTTYVGQGLCHRGKVSGYSCGYVTSVSFAPTWSEACNGLGCSAVFVRASGTNLANRRGDSGGPWFGGAYAYGIHSGGLIADVGAWAAFTPIAKISTLGVTLYK